jgi:NAD(P)H-dependent FMN reductase
MSQPPVHIAIIIGSTREGRFADVVANWFIAQMAQYDNIEVDVIDLADTALPVTFSRETSSALTAFAERIDRADGFVVVTPEYNHSYPASLKHAIDLAHAEWSRKPVAFVSYGGLAGGLRAVEHLRHVFAELRAMTIRDTVSFHSAWERFDSRGELVEPEIAEAAAVAMVDDLIWWAVALRSAKSVDASR